MLGTSEVYIKTTVDIRSQELQAAMCILALDSANVCKGGGFNRVENWNGLCRSTRPSLSLKGEL